MEVSKLRVMDFRTKHPIRYKLKVLEHLMGAFAGCALGDITLRDNIRAVQAIRRFY